METTSMTTTEEQQQHIEYQPAFCPKVSELTWDKEIEFFVDLLVAVHSQYRDESFFSAIIRDPFAAFIEHLEDPIVTNVVFYSFLLNKIQLRLLKAVSIFCCGQPPTLDNVKECKDNLLDIIVILKDFYLNQTTKDQKGLYTLFINMESMLQPNLIRKVACNLVLDDDDVDDVDDVDDMSNKTKEQLRLCYVIRKFESKSEAKVTGPIGCHQPIIVEKKHEEDKDTPVMKSAWDIDRPNTPERSAPSWISPIACNKPIVEKKHEEEPEEMPSFLKDCDITQDQYTWACKKSPALLKLVPNDDSDLNTIHAYKDFVKYCVTSGYKIIKEGQHDEKEEQVLELIIVEAGMVAPFIFDEEVGIAKHPVKKDTPVQIIIKATPLPDDSLWDLPQSVMPRIYRQKKPYYFIMPFKLSTSSNIVSMMLPITLKDPIQCLQQLIPNDIVFDDDAEPDSYIRFFNTYFDVRSELLSRFTILVSDTPYGCYAIDKETNTIFHHNDRRLAEINKSHIQSILNDKTCSDDDTSSSESDSDNDSSESDLSSMSKKRKSHMDQIKLASLNSRNHKRHGKLLQVKAPRQRDIIKHKKVDEFTKFVNNGCDFKASIVKSQNYVLRQTVKTLLYTLLSHDPYVCQRALVPKHMQEFIVNALNVLGAQVSATPCDSNIVPNEVVEIKLIPQVINVPFVTPLLSK